MDPKSLIADTETKATNPSAFPMDFDTSYQRGMTLRDYFAGQALVGLSPLLNGKDAGEAARRAYQAADAMLNARQS